MQRGGSDSCSPWWERFQEVAEKRNEHGDGCSFRTLERIECKVEYDPDTKQPNRKCQRILQKFRECPGRCDAMPMRCAWAALRTITCDVGQFGAFVPFRP